MKIIGRMPDDGDLDARSECDEIAAATEAYVSGAIGRATVTLYKSEDDEDRGGFVLGFTIADDTSSFIPHAEIVPNGVLLHLGGEAEGDALIRCLIEALRLAKCSAAAAQTQAARDLHVYTCAEPKPQTPAQLRMQEWCAQKNKTK